jgi:hypothetical protein
MKYLMILICVCVFPAAAVACDCCPDQQVTRSTITCQVPTTVYDEYTVQIPRTVMVDQQYQVESYCPTGEVTTTDEGGRDLRRGVRRRLERRLDRNQRVEEDSERRIADLLKRLGKKAAPTIIGNLVPIPAPGNGNGISLPIDPGNGNGISRPGG